MREIKFRAWDKRFKWMKYGAGDLLLILNEKDYSEVMQYTGLKDKNGKEIYEGDIVEIKWGNAVERNIVKYDVGTFSSGFLFFKGVSDDASGYNMLWGIKDSEIVGNIYENRDLLSKLNEQK